MTFYQIHLKIVCQKFILRNKATQLQMLHIGGDLTSKLQSTFKKLEITDNF